MCPGINSLPSSAWATGRLERRPMISGMRLRWRGSRCCTHTTITPMSAGRRRGTAGRACTPPAEAAMAMMSNGGWLRTRSGVPSVRRTVPPVAGQLGRADLPEVTLLLEARDLDLEHDHILLPDCARHVRLSVLSVALTEVQ